MSPTRKPTYEELASRIEALEYAEKESALLRARLEHVMDIARLGYWEHDVINGVFTLNDQVYKIFHTTVDAVGGYTLSTDDYLRRFVHPEDIPFTRKEIRNTLESGGFRQPHQFEHRVLYANGTTGHIVVRYFQVKTEGNRTITVCGVIQDITEHREMENRLRAITDSARDAILMMDPQGRISFWNPAAHHILGYSEREAIGKNLHALIAPEHFQEDFFSAFPEFIRSGKGAAVGRTLELNAICKDGIKIPVELSLSGVSLHGEWHAVGLLRDITDRKKTEAALREGERRFRSLVKMLPEVVFECDLELNLTFVNEQAYAIFGYSMQDLEKGLNVIDMLPPEEFERAQRNIQKRFRGELSGVKEYRGLKKDGTTFPMLLHAVPILAEGKAIGLRGVIVDITERKKIQEQLLQGQKMNSIGTLAGGIAHDFNNILQPILGYSEFLRTELPADCHQQGYVEGIVKASLRAKELVKQILAFSRQSDQKTRAVRLEQIVTEAVKLSRSTIPANIRISEEIPRSRIFVMANPSQLHQITMNLIINAYHAVLQSSGEISVGLRKTKMEIDDLQELSLRPAEYAELWVSDTGAGIDPAIMRHIFEPYFTTKPIGEGSGLGLSVVYGIVKATGGDIRVQSEIGKGTTFHVFLPLTPPPPEKGGPEAEEKLPTGNERILLVDDEEMVVRIAGMMLERLGYRVTTFQSSRDALEMFKADPTAFDLVITDMAMPNMTGDQLARELILLRPRMPIIICTGYSEQISQSSAEAIGVSDFLMKPISISELSKKVRKVLDGIPTEG